MASDPNRWFELWDTFGSLFRSDGAAAAKLQLSNLEKGDLQSLCGAAGIPVEQLGGKSKTEQDMVEELLRNLSCYRDTGSWVFYSSSGPQRSTQQSSQQLREDEIFENEDRLNEKDTPPEMRFLQQLRGDDHVLDADWVRKQLHKKEVKELKLMLGPAGVDPAVVDPNRGWQKEARSSSSSWPQRSTQQIPQQLREDVIFEDEDRLSEELEIKTQEELRALCAGVPRARGEDWMRQRWRVMNKELMRKLARNLGLRAQPSYKPKVKKKLIEEMMQLLAPPTAAWLCMDVFFGRKRGEQALRQGNGARSWWSDQLRGMSARARKGAKESDLAAVAREAGLEEIVGLKKEDLVRIIVDKLAPRELDADAAVEQRACLLSACIKMKEKGEEVDAAAMEKHLESRELLVKLAAWLRRERLEVIESQHRSSSEMLAQLVVKVRDLLQGCDLRVSRQRYRPACARELPSVSCWHASLSRDYAFGLRSVFARPEHCTTVRSLALARLMRKLRSAGGAAARAGAGAALLVVLLQMHGVQANLQGHLQRFAAMQRCI
eukprot:s45_g44.t2